jgi:hypothetical protein
MGSRLRDHTRSFDSGVRARSNSCRTLPAEGIGSLTKGAKDLKYIVSNGSYYIRA